MGRVNLNPNEEIRTEVIKLYPNQEHFSILSEMQEEVRQVWNHIVRSRQDTKKAVLAYAIKHKLVPDPPMAPVRPVLPKPELNSDKDHVQEQWKEYRRIEKEYKYHYGRWMSSVFKVTCEIPECSWRNDDYKFLRKLYCRLSKSVLIRDTVQRAKESKNIKYKKPGEDIPLVWGNSSPIQVSEFYGNRRGHPFYNAKIKVDGLPPIMGRLRRKLPGKPIQGFSIFKRADGWYAAIKCIVTKRQLPEPVSGPIGVDVGQTDLVALSDGYTEHNPRDAEFVALKAEIQKKGDLSPDTNVQARCRSKVARMDQNRKRRITHWINSELLPRLEKHSLVFVEKLAKNFKSNRGPLSCMHIILDAIKQRLGARVREIDPVYTSQICSCCGSEETVREGKHFACLASGCEAILDADVNAARNILARGLQMLAA